MKNLIKNFVSWLKNLFNKKAVINKKELVPHMMSRSEKKELRKFINAHTPRQTKPCAYCKEPMIVSRGQICYFHRNCRKMARSRKVQVV